MATYFISDLHLSEKHPNQAQLFFDFMTNTAPKADALYILGDFFNIWIGDDDLCEFHQRVIDTLNQFSKTGTPLYFMHGNRDFLIGDDFEKAAGFELLNDPSVVEIYGEKVLLAHGDGLCLDDKRHLRFRGFTQSWLIKKIFLSLSLSRRRNMAKKIREHSHGQEYVASDIRWDVTHAETLRLMRRYQVKTLIHGHTHRPSLHYFQMDGESVCRVVLSDWGSQGNVLIWENDGTKRLVYFGGGGVLS